jgi:hypothetical protein
MYLLLVLGMAYGLYVQSQANAELQEQYDRSQSIYHYVLHDLDKCYNHDDSPNIH